MATLMFVGTAIYIIGVILVFGTNCADASEANKNRKVNARTTKHTDLEKKYKEETYIRLFWMLTSPIWPIVVLYYALKWLIILFINAVHGAKLVAQRKGSK